MPSQGEEPLLASRLDPLRLLCKCISRSPASALLSFNAFSRSTRSLHWFSISLRAAHSARSVSVLGVQAAGSLVALCWWIWLRASRHDRSASASLFYSRQSLLSLLVASIPVTQSRRLLSKSSSIRHMSSAWTASDACCASWWSALVEQ